MSHANIHTCFPANDRDMIDRSHMQKNNLFYILLGIALLLITTGASYWIFSSAKPLSIISSNQSKTTLTPTAKKSKVDPSIPKTEICPLNGALFTKQEKDIWATRRPLGVMIENSVDARPQSGLSTADVVYEAVAEGGITRFMAMFYCNAPLTNNLMVAPVRSARIYFVNLIAEYDGLYNHVGGAGNCDDPNVDPRAKALCVIRKNNIKDLDQFGLDFKTCHRVTNRLDKDVAYEHTMACFIDELYNEGADRKWTNVDSKGVSWDKNFVSWKFKDPTKTKATGSAATKIAYFFWGQSRGVGEEFNRAFDVVWNYDAATNQYLRTNGGQKSIDLNTGDQLAFTNVVVQFTKEVQTGDLEKHMLYENIGQGRALVFMDGVAVDASWSKAALKSRTIFKDAKGKEITFNPGPIWISLVPSVNEVTYN